MNALRLSILLLVCFSIGCPTPATVTEEDEAPTEKKRTTKRSTDSSQELQFVGEPVAVSPQFGYEGCTPLAESELLEGEVRMLDFGKGKDGVVIDDGEVKWVVSYDAEGVYSEFEKERVLVRGRQCELKGAGVRAYHFDTQSIRLLR